MSDIVGQRTGREAFGFHEITVIQGSARRRHWTWEEKARIVAESLDPTTTASAVARVKSATRPLLDPQPGRMARRVSGI